MAHEEDAVGIQETDHGGVLPRLWQCGERLGLWPSVLCWIVWVGGGVFAARAFANALWPHPRLGTAIVWTVAIGVALGGLVGFWVIADLAEFWRRGYRVRWVAANRWIYEERAPGGVLHAIPLTREIVGSGYPAPCRVRLPDEAHWQNDTPEWVRRRRADILARIARCFGADAGGQVHFDEL